MPTSPRIGSIRIYRADVGIRPYEMIYGAVTNELGFKDVELILEYTFFLPLRSGR